jgi:hypothetical protein
LRQLSIFFALTFAASMTGAGEAAVRLPAGTAVAAGAGGSVIGSLPTITTIGSTIDPVNGDSNPYGLAVAPAAGGGIALGDLVVCNFNDSLNIQGLGTTIEVLAPVPGSKPQRLIGDPRLTGCAAIAMGGAAPWVAALDANDNPIVSPTGQLLDAINNFGWTEPWGQAFVAGPNSPAAFYETNANDGSIVRINLGSAFTFDKIARGFPVNHGAPGKILAPSGLTYDAGRDVLYVVDGAVNALIAIKNPATIQKDGITIRGASIEGPYASRVKVLRFGAPLKAPISAALLFNGNIVVGNTGDNRLIELTPEGKFIGQKILDGGAPGALFGIAATGTSAATTKIYFNDDNTNTVNVLSH